MDAAEPGAWLLLAAAVRVAGIVLALVAYRRPRASLGMAFGASAVASALTGALGFLSLGVGDPARGHLTHAASGLSFGYAVDPLSAWFLLVLALLAAPSPSTAWPTWATAGPGRSAFVGVGFNVLLGAVEAVFVADGVIGFLFAWELMTLADGGARRDRAREAREPPRRLPLPGDVPRRRRAAWSRAS